MAPRKILVADEDIDTRVILRTILERHAFIVDEAANAEQAYTLCEARRFDLIVFNYPMTTPGDGTLVQRIRALPQCEHTPILNLTSRVVPQFLQEAAEQGVTLSVPKPIDVDQIVQIVTDLISGSAVAAK